MKIFSQLSRGVIMTRIRARAFTLVELLVVIAIIAILIAILLPGLGRAKRVAKTSRCLANTRGLDQTLMFYMNDRQKLIPYDYPNNFWTSILKEYGNSNKLRVCPEVVEEPTFGTNAGAIVQGSVNKPWSVYEPSAKYANLIPVGAYSLNGWLEANSPLTYASAGGPANAGMLWKWPIVGAPHANIPVFGEGTWPDGWPLEVNGPPANLTSGAGSNNGPPGHMSRFVIARHNKAINVGFVDNHAETVPLEGLWKLKWHAQWTRSGMPVGQRLPAK
jgi:prepilin-type N-terminal cleavage/methylation domain-containing protein/prepilin-type processing-associated H-X9-DG protein